MNSIPPETIMMIIKHLPPKEYYHYLTISRQWYHILLSFIYRDIKYLQLEQREMFMSMAKFNFPIAGKYVRSLDCRWEQSHVTHQTVKVIMDNATNLERIDVFTHQPFIDYLLRADVSSFQNLREIKANHRKMSSMHFSWCLTKYKNTINHIDISKDFRDYLTQGGSKGLLEFIQQFPNLHKLYLDNSCKHPHKNLVFLSDLLDHSCNISDLRYKHLYSKTYPQIDRLSATYPSLVSINWLCGDMNGTICEGLSHSFPHLKHIVMHSSRVTASPKHIRILMSSLVALPSLETMLLNSHEVTISAVREFSCAFAVMASDAEWRYKTSLWTGFSSSGTQLNLCLEKKKKIIHVIWSTPCLKTHLEHSGEYIDYLEVLNGGPISVDLSQINQFSLHLKKLTVWGLYRVSSLHYSNWDLLTLNLRDEVLTKENCRQIEKLYPNLQTLGMGNSLHSSDQNIESEIDLPYTPLRKVILSKVHKSCCKIIIKKVVQSVLVRQWVYEAGSDFIRLYSGDHITPPATADVVVYTHSTIDSVDLE